MRQKKNFVKKKKIFENINNLVRQAGKKEQRYLGKIRTMYLKKEEDQSYRRKNNKNNNNVPFCRFEFVRV